MGWKDIVAKCRAIPRCVTGRRDDQSRTMAAPPAAFAARPGLPGPMACLETLRWAVGMAFVHATRWLTCAVWPHLPGFAPVPPVAQVTPVRPEHAPGCRLRTAMQRAG